MRLKWSDPRNYRLTIEDYDPTWSEWHLDRLPGVHGAPASEGHYWSLNGRWIEGYSDGAVCGLCGWSPDFAAKADAKTSPIGAALAAARYEDV